jgi:hypothetical protein
MVRQWQELFYEERYSNTVPVARRICPTSSSWAEAMGCVGLRCESPDEVDATIEKAMEIDDRPVVVDFRVDRDEMVWPMVAAGTSNDDIIRYARDLAPSSTRGRPVSQPHAVRPGREQARRAGPVAGLFAGAASTSTASRSARPRPERLSRMTIVVDVEVAPLEQVTKQLNKLVNVIKIVELDPAQAVSASCCWSR